MLTDRINGKIRAPEVRIVNQHGVELGVLPLVQALELARSRGEDLIEVDSATKPPLCKLMDYGLYRWQLQQSGRNRAGG